MRKKLERHNPEALKIKMWLFPYLAYFTILILLVILTSMLFIKSMVSPLLLTLLITAIVIVFYFAFAKKRGEINYGQQTSPLIKD